MSDTRWNGQPCEARRVTAVVADDGTFPMYWARHLVGTRRKAVEVTYGGEVSYLDDEDGSGWNKVTHGGSPHWTHSSLTIEPGSVQARAEDAVPPLADRAALERVREYLETRLDQVAVDPADVLNVLTGATEPPLSPYYSHEVCGFHWHGRDGLDIPMRDGQPVCPRCELRRLAGATSADTPERPRCPHCRLPHDLDPGSGAVVACESIRASIAEAERFHGEGDHTRCARVDCEVVRARRDGAQP